ncbi:hypothetical protein ACA910_014617 [Epithemia clementina (nom. ined.)]
MVIVTKSNFIEQSNDFLAHLPTAAFVAVDEEMTGITLPSSNSRRSSKDEPPHLQYQDLKKVPETYSIIQLGISLFHYTGNRLETVDTGSSMERQAQPADRSSTSAPGNSSTDNSTQPQSNQNSAPSNVEHGGADWTVRRYNFFSFPGKDSDRSVVLNPGAVAFLHQHNISFDKWTKEGIPFQQRSKANETLEHYLKKQLAADAEKKDTQQQPTVEEASRRKLHLRRPEDVDFFSRTMAGLRGWLDSPVPPPDLEQEGGPAEGACYMLPECNSFLRRALYESIQQEYPSLILEKAPNSYRICVWRLSDEEKERRELRLKKEAWEKLIVEQVGLYRIFYALSQAARGFALDRDTPLLAATIDDVDWDKELSLYRGPKHRKIPIVVHNGFMDLCFLLSHFVAPQLPDSLSKCKEVIRWFFPVVYDTKILALEYSPVHYNDNTRLGALFQRVKSQIEGRVDVLRVGPDNSLQTHDDGGSASSASAGQAPAEEEHFADYDAYMTGVCFLGICQSILRTADPSNSSTQSSGVVARPNVGTLVHLLAPVYDPQVRKYFGRNILYQMSIYNLDLEDSERDPLCRGMRSETTFRVSSIDPSITTRDIVNCVSGLYDKGGRPINFEIIWVDDTTFMVAATYRVRRSENNNDEANDEAILQEHGELIQYALKRRFDSSTVISLEEHLQNSELGVETGATDNTLSSLAKRLLGWIGIGSENISSAAEPLAKKRRLGSN